MDEDDHYADEREALLERFRESLNKPMSERYFDEDDLIEIFDYAGDLNDDFLRMEALMCAARYYPDSEELLERRGIFYSQFSDDAREQFLKHNQQSGNLILELLALRHDSPKPAKAKERLAAMLDRYDRLSDEEVIQFVDAASALDCFGWLEQNMDLLRKKANFEVVAVYEMAVAADIRHEYELSAKMFEELTQMEPFNSYYWIQLARAYAELDDAEKSLSAIDYSLAIKPDSPQALLVKARLLQALDHPKTEVEALLDYARRLVKKDDVESLRFLSSTYSDLGQDLEARKALEAAYAAARDGQELDIIPDLLQLCPDRADELFDAYYSGYEDNSQLMWVSWAHQLSIQGFPELSRKAIECYERNSGEKIPSLLGVEEAFANQRFADAVGELKDYVESLDSISVHDRPTVFTVQLLSLVKMKHFEEAREFCRLCIENIDLSKYPSMDLRLQYFGLLNLAYALDEMMEKPRKVKWDDLDPLAYWSLPKK